MTVAHAALYMCDVESCAVVAPHRTAMKHERDTGHHTVRLTVDEANDFRRIWRRQNRCWLCGNAVHDHECGV